MEKYTAEVWVKVIGIVGIVFAALGALVGLGVIFGGGFLATIFMTLVPAGENGFGALLGSLAIVLGIIILIVSLFEIFLYVKFMKYANWARIVVLVFAALGFIGGLFSLPTGILGLIINGGIFYLLTWQKEVIALFK